MARQNKTKAKPSRQPALAAASVGALVAGIGAVLAGYWLRRRAAGTSPEHAAPDLPAPGASRPAADARAPVAFRPDPTAAVSPAERESLRPATGPSPSIVEDRGAVRSLP